MKKILLTLCVFIIHLGYSYGQSALLDADLSGMVRNEGIEIVWKITTKTIVAIQHSSDGKKWTTIKENATSPSIIPNKWKKNYVRLVSGEKKSNVIIFKINKGSNETEVSDLFGNKIVVWPRENMIK